MLQVATSQSAIRAEVTGQINDVVTEGQSIKVSSCSYLAVSSTQWQMLQMLLLLSATFTWHCFDNMGCGSHRKPVDIYLELCNTEAV
jgi:hypothetical protein